MTVLIVTSDHGLADRCGEALASVGLGWRRAASPEAAEGILAEQSVSLMLVSLGGQLGPGTCLVGLCLIAACRYPGLKVIVLVLDNVRPDGSLMALSPNIAAYLSAGVARNDLAILAMHHANRRSGRPFAGTVPAAPRSRTVTALCSAPPPPRLAAEAATTDAAPTAALH
jgi:hypothetical protein